MHRNWIKQFVSGFLWLSCSTAGAQVDSLLQRADRLLSYNAYGRAIGAYRELLAVPEHILTAAQKATVQRQLSYAYRQVGDGEKAERLYRESLSGSSGDDALQTLNFAQSLAGNGKFQEAQQQYERYLQQKDKVTLRAPFAISAASAALKNGPPGAVRYRLEYLSLNSSGEEFSPAFYQDGLVYVSGSKGGSAIETSGRGGGSGYLDLFYAPNRSSLKITSLINANGVTSQVTVIRTKGRRQVGADDYSRPTANDSRTVPTFGGDITGGYGAPPGLARPGQTEPTKPSQRLSKTLNSAYHEGPATFSRDGSQIIFTRNNYSGGRLRKSADGVTKLKLYTARQQNGVWKDVTELPFNNDDYSVGHPALSRDGQLLYFASDMPGGLGGTDLYVSRYLKGQWSRPVNLGEDINTKGNELFPFADDAGNLYFSTNGRKGLGELDIFFATVTTLATGLIVQSVDHLDAPINSPKDDFGLITDGNRSGGYFSSNRRDGNDDIYRFVRESSLYGCRNLTIRLYERGSDAALDGVSVLVKGAGQADQTLLADTNGLVRLCLNVNNDFTFQASRDGYRNCTVGFSTRSMTDDQPSWLEMGMVKPTKVVNALPPRSTYPSGSLTRSRIRGVVISERDRRPLEGVTVRLRNECNRTQLKYITGPDGRYAFDLAGGCNYTLVASKPAFGTNTNKIKRLPRKAKPKVLSADLRMLSVGDVVTIDNIYYDLDRFSLRPDAARELEKLVATMRKYPSLIIEIRSHTDSRGSGEQNKLLSAQRAKAVANLLAARGISRRRIATSGMGESQLANNCTDGVICTDAEHQRNRRTEFRVVAIK